MPLPVFPPSREAELLIWAANFDQLITATPVAFGLTAAQATAFGNLRSDFVAKYATAVEPTTNSRAAVVAKNESKAALLEGARELIAIVQAFPGTTNEMRAGLGIKVRDGEPTPVPPPSVSPEIDIVSSVMRTVRLRVHNETTLGRRKPDGVAGALIFSFVGAQPPAPQDTHLWKFEVNTTKTTADVQFPSDVPSGATVWFTAFWYNPRGESGPAAAAAHANLPGTLSMAA